MSPVAIPELNATPYKTSDLSALDWNLFPDGLKTSGQHPGIYELIPPYEEWPKSVSGPTLWKAEDYQNSPEKWTKPFTPEEIKELGEAADKFMASGMPLTGMKQELFPLPILGPYFKELRKEILDGRGFVLFRNVPVREWGNHKSAVAYMGLGTYFGYFTSQNSRGHVLGHVKDLGEDPTAKDRVRIYRTADKQFFHTDGTDLVGLLCMARALEGGESHIASTHNMYNVLQAERPDIVKLLVSPIWYFDRKGEVSEGEEPYFRSSVFYLEAPNPDDPKSERRVYARYDPNNITSLARFNSGPNAVIPPLSPEQLEALKVLEETANRLCLHMVLQPGDIQLVSNTHVVHDRTAYKDWPVGSVDEEGKPRIRRHLMRLWLATPEQEGGWRLVHPDSKEKKRGGVQVHDVPPICPLDAE
ncbi:hypothetical protein TREMEDRAFT_59233 [Tremella mesenterica DSM 1558]|uniref:uncharacterized protein n=1 Tax=Tremella mesenterica (strain ATCC 24925 / CBS 8224 / DSM 1558 / NBRC 9311 / NRRL Y-6157 / RJB 2259-6 / UBC 559-6) TaxID=578456 RepID=UPI0003F48C31|nr:uncharacterized protein TREMEDRAFT_59233 [Tremella mesenterica DSM 1558]EIW73072.1 hypothetical protein TREMEDRAFT_59233 [Tremella mesenterica DSM 1558]